MPPFPVSALLAPLLPVLAGVVVAGVLEVLTCVVDAGVLVAWLVLPFAAVVEPLPALSLVVVVPRSSSVLVVTGVRFGGLLGALSLTFEPPHAEIAAALSVAAPSIASDRRRGVITPRRGACADRTSGSR